VITLKINDSGLVVCSDRQVGGRWVISDERSDRWIIICIRLGKMTNKQASGVFFDVGDF
jgi:hypothetical protein